MKNTVILFLTLFTCASVLGKVAPNGPGVVPNWSVAKKVQVGTYYKSLGSPVWFTNASGVLTETYFPTIDKAQIKDSQFLITDRKGIFLEERKDLIHEVSVRSASLVTLKNTDRQNRFSISHTFYTLKHDSILVDEVVIDTRIDGLDFYLLVNPAMNNTGYNDNGRVLRDNSLVFSENKNQLNVYATTGFDASSVGYVGVNDGWQQIQKYGQIIKKYDQVYAGNIAGTGKVKIPAKKGVYKFYILYSFTGQKDFSPEVLSDAKTQYQTDWARYIASLKDSGLSGKDKLFYDRTIYTLRVHEDKLNPGAMIASLSKPWGDETREYPGVFVGGYHLVWPRDLYHVALAMINAGDLDAPRRALGFLKTIQYQRGEWKFDGRTIPKKGAFPQNVWTHRGEYWGGLQLDQVGFPVQLFYQLYRRVGPKEQAQLMREYGSMIHDALEFIYKYGPWSAQERWEENFGISPSTFSVATAALIVGSKMTGNLKYAKRADQWLNKPGDNIHTWTFTTRGAFDDGQYYIRVGGCSNHTANWNPDNGARCTVANSGRPVEQTKLLDQGFLKLALHGLVPASDWRLKTSLAKVNRYIRKTKDGYSAWYRYSFDAYGENKQGRLWPLLSSEHGRYEIERFNDGDQSWSEARRKANHILDSYKVFANNGLMIPEQVFEGTFEGTGAATPLAWSHAEYLKLFWSIKQKRNVENPLEL